MDATHIMVNGHIVASGDASLVDKINREGYEDPELGFVIGVPWQRQGYATEVCKALLEYGKEDLGFEQVQMLVMPENRVSLRLAEKLGFHRQDQVTWGGSLYERLLLEL